ncbi:MAG TPA: S8 family serine peptidase [Jatrophihabitans sp.]|uniref:S8 family serine peptidase n=1 Tax=Jatrophihabitans sp. TaxID=1932789 RepID=UPI002DF73ADD|nr:S8 family serine peptidase [Jatrophihabitans sp.]
MVPALAAALVLVASVPAAAAPGPTGAPEYWFDAWQVERLWADGAHGQGVTIAEIDTGVNAALPELAGRILSGTDLGAGGNGQTDREIDQFGHGTAMASIMVARPGTLDITGLAPDAKVLPVAVPLDGTTDAGRPDRLDDAVRYAADHGAKIISMSVGGKRLPSDGAPCSPEEQAAVFHALAKGAIVIAAVGNTGPTQNTVEEPASCLGVVSVGAVDRSGSVARFSGRQPYLSMVAPGVNIPSLGRVPGQAYSGDGTSQATALVSAAAALVWSKYPTLSGRQVVTRLLQTLDDRRSPPGPDYGYGRLNAYAAVTAAVPANAPNPVYDRSGPFQQRADSFAKGSGLTAPAPAARGAGDTGDYRVGAAPGLNRAAYLGAGAAVIGVAALVVLWTVGVRRRRARRAFAAAGPWAVGWPPPPPAVAPTGERPRPRPGPVPPPVE